MKSIFIDCSSGVSGDMLLGGFIDLGVPSNIINDPLKSLGLSDDYHFKYEEGKTINLRGIRVSIQDNYSTQKSRTWLEIRELITTSNLSIPLKESILKVFQLIAEVESFVHGISADKVHFHEIGCIDSLVDII